MVSKFKLLFLITCCIGTVMLSAQESDIKVRIFSNEIFHEALFRPKNGTYFITAIDSQRMLVDTIIEVSSAGMDNLLTITKQGTHLLLFKGRRALGRYHGLYFIAGDTSCSFLFHLNKKERWYDGSLYIWSTSQSMVAVNHVDLEQYVAGVVESEGGNFPELEYFKAQAVLARTFAIRNITKHLKEGYNLKDDITSQVYHSRAYYRYSDLIRKAVSETRDTIVVDSASRQPIFAAFHANSGGHTVCAEDAWHRKLPNLVAKEDPYSVGMNSYQWTKRLPKKDVQEYIARKLGLKVTSELIAAIDSFHQPVRLNHFRYQNKSFPLRDFRFHFQLKSTFFDIQPDGNQYILSGKGNGHGVGLSQEGAINMASQGFSYKEIIYFYYQNVSFESLSQYKQILAEATQLAF
ncbi:SpoIID/LytB domain-containing protein [Schleiferia thermophila]|jgi:stage II sporulation protein D|uniref:Stage II sporulation protein D n=1 Tax=Schleiferia thermophila TaxID=884107 RepID=A0A369A7T6_9FLAO|nr:SpoIID/LytB domain-containing protein [Schleiferia thermophila]KFD38637.1 hypothetical protein AT05_09250 [Schleiferia thermophila str. Yellowstone]RCX05203.1 stage II sporulation protein D [Schleiferia thermophila]